MKVVSQEYLDFSHIYSDSYFQCQAFVGFQMHITGNRESTNPISLFWYKTKALSLFCHQASQI